MIEIVGMIEKEILQVLKNDFKDFEDFIQYFCVIIIFGFEVILIRNVKDYVCLEIVVFILEYYLKIMGG